MQPSYTLYYKILHSTPYCIFSHHQPTISYLHLKQTSVVNIYHLFRYTLPISLFSEILLTIPRYQTASIISFFIQKFQHALHDSADGQSAKLMLPLNHPHNYLLFPLLHLISHSLICVLLFYQFQDILLMSAYSEL